MTLVLETEFEAKLSVKTPKQQQQQNLLSKKKIPKVHMNSIDNQTPEENGGGLLQRHPFCFPFQRIPK